MTVIIGGLPIDRTKAYNLTRYEDQNGNLVEVRKNRLPRGKTFKRLHDIEWRAMGEDLKRIERLCRSILADYGDSDER